MIKGVIYKLVKTLFKRLLGLRRHKKPRQVSQTDSETSNVTATTPAEQPTVKNDDADAFRKSIGEWLMNYRISKDMSVYKVAKDGNIRIVQAQSVESGDTNYTINVFAGYLKGCNLKMTFTEGLGQ